MHEMETTDNRAHLHIMGHLLTKYDIDSVVVGKISCLQAVFKLFLIKPTHTLSDEVNPPLKY